MQQPASHEGSKPFNIHDRLLLFACDVVRVVRILHSRGPIARALSYQILAAGIAVGSNGQEGDGASSTRDFVAKMRIALREAKETRFRLTVCRRCHLLGADQDGLLTESGELIAILGSIVHKARRRLQDESANAKDRKKRRAPRASPARQ